MILVLFAAVEVWTQIASDLDLKEWVWENTIADLEQRTLGILKATQTPRFAIVQNLGSYVEVPVAWILTFKVLVMTIDVLKHF